MTIRRRAQPARWPWVRHWQRTLTLAMQMLQRIGRVHSTLAAGQGAWLAVRILASHYDDISAVLAEHRVIREQRQRLGQRLRQQQSIKGIAMQGREVTHLGGMFAAHRQYAQTRRLQRINDSARVGIEFSERAFYAYFPYGCRADEHLAAFDERARTRFELGGLREGPQQQMSIEKNAQRMPLIAVEEPHDGFWQ